MVSHSEQTSYDVHFRGSYVYFAPLPHIYEDHDDDDNNDYLCHLHLPVKVPTQLLSNIALRAENSCVP